MKKLEDVFVPSAARQNALWSEFYLARTGAGLQTAAPVTGNGLVLVVTQPLERLGPKAVKRLDSLPEPLEVEVVAPDGATSAGWAFANASRRKVTALRNLLHHNFHWELSSGEVCLVGPGSEPWKLRRSAMDSVDDHEAGLGLSFEQATSEAFGKSVSGRQKRLRARGWWLDVKDAIPCPACTKNLQLFSCLQRLRSGSFKDLHAAVCGHCEEVWFADQLSGPSGRAMSALAAWSLANDDVPESYPNMYSCYVINLKDENAAKLSDDRPWVYVGYTSDLEKRLGQHRSGDPKASKWTKAFFHSLNEDLTAPFVEAFGTEAEAMAYEKYLAATLEIDGYGVKSN